MRIGPGERVLELVELHRAQASIIEQRDPSTARFIRSLADEYERVVRRALPEWIPLATVKARTGWSDKWLWERCRELEPEGLARKKGRYWLLHRDAVSAIPAKEGDQEEIDAGGDLVELARELAAG